MRISDWSSDVCSSDLPAARTWYGSGHSGPAAGSAGWWPRRSGRQTQSRRSSCSVVFSASVEGGAAQQAAGNDHAHDLVGTFEYLVHAGIAQIALDRIILQVTVATMQLQKIGRAHV